MSGNQKTELEFHGAAGTVTGSMHILHLPDGPIALDSGLFQGRRSWARELNESFPLPPKDLRSVILTHAHIDHSGKIPQLCREGFRGRVYATPATCDLCDVMLADSAHIQEEDARFWNRKRAKDESEHIKPLYTIEDAKAAEKQFQAVEYKKQIDVLDGCKVTLFDAGHILGSAYALVEINHDRPIRLLYTGDLGRFDVPILRDPEYPLPEVDYLITESTYANRLHENPKHMKESLARIIDETRQAGGKVVIPAFSVGRTQNVVFYLARAMSEGLLKPLPIYVDSPLSTRTTTIFKRHPECYDAQAEDFWQERGDIFGDSRITYITDVNESKALNEVEEPCVIISASGMCEAGRILHHLKNNIEDKRNTVIVVGFMAQSTLGRRIVERHQKLKIFGMEYRLAARVEVLNGFSAHADIRAFKRLLGPIAPKLKGAFVVHGEEARLEAMKQLLGEIGCANVQAPAPGEKFEL